MPWISVTCLDHAHVRNNPAKKPRGPQTRGEGKHTVASEIEAFVNAEIARFAASEEGRKLAKTDPVDAPPVRVVFMPGHKDKGALCRYNPATKEAFIELHGGIWADLTEEERFNTIAHETAHAIEFRRYNKSDHGSRWQFICKALGGSGSAVMMPSAGEKLEAFNRKKSGLPPPPTAEEMAAARALFVVGDWVSFEVRKGRGKAKTSERVIGKVTRRKEHHATVAPFDEGKLQTIVSFDVPYYQLRRELPPEARPTTPAKVPGVDKPAPGESLSAWQERTGRARPNPAPSQDFDRAMENAQAFVAALAAVTGAPTGKAWGKPGVGVRVYIGRDWLSIGRDGTVRGAGGRGGGTFVESALYPSQRRAYKQAFDAYLAQLRERIEAEMQEALRDNPGRPLTGFDLFDIQDAEPSAPSGKTLEGTKRGDVLQVGKTRWVLFQVSDNFTGYAYKHPSKHTKAYRIRPDNEGNADVHEINGVGVPVAHITTGKLVRTGEQVAL